MRTSMNMTNVHISKTINHLFTVYPDVREYDKHVI